MVPGGIPYDEGWTLYFLHQWELALRHNTRWGFSATVSFFFPFSTAWFSFSPFLQKFPNHLYNSRISLQYSHYWTSQGGVVSEGRLPSELWSLIFLFLTCKSWRCAHLHKSIRMYIWSFISWYCVPSSLESTHAFSISYRCYRN